MQLCFATNNKHKLEEVAHAVNGKFDIISLADIKCFEILPETQDTLTGNALQKAGYVFSTYNVPCFADDSGLEVEALGHAPGVFSARYAGNQKNSDDNINLLLKNLEGVKDRSARFHTVIALTGLGSTQYFEGIIQGKILREKKGSGGFGYDSVFQPEGFDRSFAEMNIAEKNKISHRAIAVQKLIAFLNNYS